MHTPNWLFYATCAISLAGFVSRTTASEAPQFNVLKGPTNAPLAKVAEIKIPQGFVFISGEDYRKLLKSEGEPVDGDEAGYLRPTNANWSVIFKYSDIGYVKDEDKDKLDADKLLDSIKRGTAAANEQRVKHGNPAIEVVGWEIPPRYDETTHNLEWAIRGAVEGRQILNYNTRLLGRKGVMELVLVVDPEELKDTLPEYRRLLGDYSFQSGQTYAEYRPGDKMAKVGLAALVVGGAAVGAAKLGLLTTAALFLKKLWKLVVVAIVAIAASIRKLFTGRKSE